MTASVSLLYGPIYRPVSHAADLFIPFNKLVIGSWRRKLHIKTERVVTSQPHPPTTCTYSKELYNQTAPRVIVRYDEHTEQANPDM